ncbi:hypothetical protein HZA33_05425 [Candidatus Pacearchaeota archaeon]|nr:hypothetical protein [Candidatus Pacearchaeota archaeon]
MGWTEGKETTKEAIEARLKVIGGDMLKIEYLENCVKNSQTLDVRKFILVKLAEQYEKKLMHAEAAKQMDGAASIAVTFKEKMDLYMLATELYIKHGDYFKADEAFKKSLACANSREKVDLKSRVKMNYINKVREFERAQRFNNAIKILEKLFSMNILTETEKQAETKKLAFFYSKVGRIPEAMKLGG